MKPYKDLNHLLTMLYPVSFGTANAKTFVTEEGDKINKILSEFSSSNLTERSLLYYLDFVSKSDRPTFESVQIRSFAPLSLCVNTSLKLEAGPYEDKEKKVVNTEIDFLIHGNIVEKLLTREGYLYTTEYLTIPSRLCSFDEQEVRSWVSDKMYTRKKSWII